MTKAKKAISVVLAVVMIAGLFAFGAFAADQNATIAVSASETQVEVGETVTVTVAATTDYYAAATSVPVYYDTAAFDLVPDSVTPSADLYGAGYTDTAINTTEAGCVMVVFIPKAGGTAQQLNNTTLFTFRLTAKANAQASPIATKAGDQKTATNIGGKLYLGAYSTADVNTATVTAVGQEFTLTNTAVTIGSAVTEPNTLVVKDDFTNASSVVIDKYADEFFGFSSGITGVIYGIETLGYADGFNTYYALSDALTTTLGDSYLRITASSAEGYESTGTLIEVLDADGSSVLETYYFVYFGDVNGDGYIDNVDGTAVKTYALNGTSLDTIQAMIAGDTNGDTYTDNVDGTALSTAVMSDSGYPVQEDLAASFWNTIVPEYGI